MMEKFLRKKKRRKLGINIYFCDYKLLTKLRDFVFVKESHHETTIIG